MFHSMLTVFISVISRALVFSLSRYIFSLAFFLALCLTISPFYFSFLFSLSFLPLFLLSRRRAREFRKEAAE